MRKINFKEHIWEKYHYLTLVWEWKRDFSKKSHPKWERRWLWKCDCWKEKSFAYCCVKSWRHKTCGCRIWWKTKRPYYKRLYSIWAWMRIRCTQKSHKQYHCYWWKWVKVERKTIESFYQDMIWSYKPWLQIDRIDNDGNYSKSNCRRVTRKENCNNRSTCIFKTMNWKTMNVEQRCKELWIYRTNFYKVYSEYLENKILSLI